MKHFLVIIVMLLFYQIDAQDDKWYIKNTRYLNTPFGAIDPTYGNPSNINSCNILNVSHPLLINGNERNDIFIIYNDGNHFNSRYIDIGDWSDYQGGADYYIGPNSTKEITHLYYANVYEGDDEPNARITVNPTAPIFAYELKVNGTGSIDRLPITSPNSTLTSNHSIVTGRDLTLIIANDSLGDCKYDLCFYKFYNQDDSLIVPPIGYQITGSEIFGDAMSPNSFVMSGASSRSRSKDLVSRNNEISGDSCIKNIVIDRSHPYTYVNLSIPEYPGGIMDGQLLEISLSSSTESPSCGIVHSIKDTIRDSNDPNYVQLMCVNKESNSPTSTIKYRAYCMNDGLEVQPNPSIEFTFPYTVTSSSDIEITRAKIRNSIQYTGFNRFKPSIEIDPYTPNRVKFSFLGCLENCPTLIPRAECEAWVEFCVKVDTSNVNVLTDTLEPFDRNTNFGSTKYPIHDYRGLPCCLTQKSRIEWPNSPGTPKDSIGSINHSNSSALSMNESRYSEVSTSRDYNSDWECLRQNRYCDCSTDLANCFWFSIICGNKIQWLKIGCILLLLLLIIFLLNKKKIKNPA